MKIVTGEDGPGPAVEAYLDGLSRSELHELVLTLAECSETVRRTLEAVADLAGDRRGAAGEDPVRRAAALLSAPKGYEDYESYDFEYGEYADNGYAADILDFLDELEALIDDGGADAAAPPLHMIIVRLRPDLYEGLGDTGGLMERASDRAAELYARACREGRPDVGALAAWLAQFRLEGLSCPELALTDFLPALGQEGLAVYRGAVEAAPQTSARLVLEVELADADGDVDRAVELLAEENTGPWYASIVERLLAAGRRDEAMAWLDRAVAAESVGRSFWDRPEDTDIVRRRLDAPRAIELYIGAGRPDDAVALAHRLFREDPGTDAYDLLLDTAERLGRRDREREAALAWIDGRNWRDADIPIALALHEGDVERAWRAADRWGADDAWQRLADAAPQPRPADAMRLYEEAVTRTLGRRSGRETSQRIAQFAVRLRDIAAAADEAVAAETADAGAGAGPADEGGGAVGGAGAGRRDGAYTKHFRVWLDNLRDSCRHRPTVHDELRRAGL